MINAKEAVEQVMKPAPVTEPDRIVQIVMSPGNDEFEQALYALSARGRIFYHCEEDEASDWVELDGPKLD